MKHANKHNIKIGTYVAIHSFLERFIFVYLIVAIAVKNEGLATSTLTSSLILHEIAKIALDTPAAIAADKTNAIWVMIFGLCAKILGLFCILFYKTFPPHSIFAGMFLIGMGSACMFSKIEPYIYSRLKKVGQEAAFPKINLIRSISANFGATISGILIGFFKTDQIHKATIIPIVLICTMHIPLLIFLNKTAFAGIKPKIKKKITKQIVKDAMSAIKTSRLMVTIFAMTILINSSFFVITDCHKALSLIHI
jgi:hypothetical protein